MTFDPFETAVQALPASKLNSLERDIEAQIGDLQDQLRMVQRVRADRVQASGSPSPAKPKPATKSPAKGGRRAKRGIGKQRKALIRQWEDAEPGKQWLPMDLEARFHAEGDTAVTRNSIRNLVREMIDADEIARHPSGDGSTSKSSADAASANGSGQEPLSEAQI